MKKTSYKVLAISAFAAFLGLPAAYSQSNTPLFRVTPDGKVGIGTASPAYRLDVVGDINLTGCVRKGSIVLAGAPCVDPAAQAPPAGSPGDQTPGLAQRVAGLERQLQDMAAQMAALQRRVNALEAVRR